MIGSFWNLCRACPSMPVDKQLHSEYRSTYRWHEFTGNSRPEVVRRPPQPNQSQFLGPTNEPPLPRRKKCPELAYKSHEFIIGSEYTDARSNVGANRMARSEERGATPSRRSKSEGPPVVPNGRAYPIPTEVDGTTTKQAATLHELEPLVSDAEDRKPHEKQVTIVEKKVTARPFSQMFDNERINHFITKKENFGFVDAKPGDELDNKVLLMNGSAPPHSQPNLDLWFKEMVELRKKAGEYKCRGWGMEIDPELYKKQKDLWEQVAKRSSLSALSLDSSVHRSPITKEEKEQENNKKSIPLQKIQQKPRVPGQAYLVDNKDEITALPARFSNIRHHLERTTGPDVEEGALLPSPTREKLMPAMTKRESESQRGSPKKTASSRHGSPQKGSPQKGSPKKVLKLRSQSVGPGVIENESPKRQIRSVSTAPTARPIAAGKKTPTSATAAPTTTTSGTAVTNAERRPRPYDAEDGRETAISISSCSPQPLPEVPDEPIVKSPPEPTRVKSPEQIIMRSPDPVNWTVPLDTGKTFTVTQNVKEGENYSRPQSEFKASTPVEKPPPPPQSAPPELSEQAKMDAWKNADLTDPKSSLSSSSPTSAYGKVTTSQPVGGVGGLPAPPSPATATTPSQPARYEGKPVPGSTLRCLDDPIFDMDVVGVSGGGVGGTYVVATTPPSTSLAAAANTASTARTAATDVLEKARDRFDRFWGGNKEENV